MLTKDDKHALKPASWKVFRREGTSNGLKFPYQQTTFKYFWLTPVGLWCEDRERAAVYPDYLSAKRDARTYRGETGKFSK